LITGEKGARGSWRVVGRDFVLASRVRFVI